MSIVTHARVARVQRRSEREYVSGYGSTAVFRQTDLGWWLLFEHSHEMLYVGMEEPPFAPNDIIKITFEKVR